MKTKAKLLWMLLFLWLSPEAQSQNETIRSENTILRVDGNKKDYSKTQIKWLMKNGFNVNDYAWDDRKVNAQLDESVNKYSGAFLFGVVAGFTGVLALTKIAIDGEGGGALLALSITSAAISGGKLQKSKRQLEQIVKWRSTSPSEKRDTTFQTPFNTSEFSIKSPYKSSQNRFLMKNGFDLHSYSWNNEQVDLRLDRAIQNRRSGNLMMGMTIAAFFAGSITNMIAAAHDVRANPEKANKSGTGFYIASGGFLLTSIIFSSSAKKKVRMAQDLRRRSL